MWYNRRMTIRASRALTVLGIALLLGIVALRSPPTELLGRVLTGDDLLRTQVESDFDQDGDIDFLDFTVFSAFYDEEA